MDVSEFSSSGFPLFFREEKCDSAGIVFQPCDPKKETCKGFVPCVSDNNDCLSLAPVNLSLSPTSTPSTSTVSSTSNNNSSGSSSTPKPATTTTTTTAFEVSYVDNFPKD